MITSIGNMRSGRWSFWSSILLFVSLVLCLFWLFLYPFLCFLTLDVNCSLCHIVSSRTCWTLKSVRWNRLFFFSYVGDNNKNLSRRGSLDIRSSTHLSRTPSLFWRLALIPVFLYPQRQWCFISSVLWGKLENCSEEHLMQLPALPVISILPSLYLPQKQLQIWPAKDWKHFWKSTVKIFFIQLLQTNTTLTTVFLYSICSLLAIVSDLDMF